MKSNSLYYVLDDLLEKNPDFSFQPQSRPLKALTQDEKAYYRIELPIADQLIDELSLEEAHISIYQKMDPNVPALSPAHFTAVWEHSSGQRYRMHIFLNDNDTLSCEPTWDRIEEDGSFHKEALPADSDFLVQSVWQTALPCLAQLREQKTALIKALEKQYNSFEAAATVQSEKFPNHPDAYQASLSRLEEPLNALVKLSSNLYWNRILIYVQKIQKHIASTTESQQTVTVSSGKEEQPAAARSNPENALSVASQTLFHKPKTNTRPYSNPINDFQRSYADMIKATNDDSKAALLFSLHQKLLILHTDKYAVTSVKLLQQLTTLEKDIDGVAQRMLQNALLNNNFELALQLYPFFETINPSIINIALMRRNSALLDFLIKYIDYPLNSYPISIKGRNYSNALSYCFLENTAANSLSACFETLVAAGANLMLPASEGQLPMAHMILSEGSSHPLNAALEHNAASTVDNKMFYEQLIIALRHYLKHTELSEHQSSDVNQAIASYRTKISLLTVSREFFSPACKQLNTEIRQVTEKMLGKSMILQIQSDPEISVLQQYLAAQTKAILQKVKLFKRKTGKEFPVNTMIHTGAEELRDALLNTKINPNRDLAEIKQEALKCLNNIGKMYHLIDELMEVQQQLLTKPTFLGKRNKGLKKLQVRQECILKEMKAVEELLPQNLLKKANAVSEIFSDLKSTLSSTFTDMYDFIDKDSALGGKIGAMLSTLEKGDFPDIAMGNEFLSLLMNGDDGIGLDANSADNDASSAPRNG